MNSCCIILLALLLPVQRWTAQVTGKILDHDGKPLAGAEVVYTNVGSLDNGSSAALPDASFPGASPGTPRITEGSGRVYKVKTDKKGDFTLIGVQYGIYRVEITASDGSHVYSGVKNIGDNTEALSQNVLHVDLSAHSGGRVAPGAKTNLAAGKKTKEQLELIRQEHSNAAKINRLIVRFHAAVDVQDWQSATQLIKELIEVDPYRWEFYQNLGTLQADQMQYREAAQSFAKGVEVAEKILANPSDSDQAHKNISDLLIAQANCYERMEKVDEAVALFDKAAAVSPQPAMAHYRACNALRNNGKTEAAIEKCTQAARDDPSQWEPYQMLGGVFENANQPTDAIEAYGKGITLAQKTLQEKPDSGRARTGLGQMLNSQGNLLLHQKKTEEAIQAFSQSADASVYPAMPYFNLCAIYYNLKRNDDAVAACDKAIAADPTMADAYFVKASVLFGQGKVEKGRYSPPAGTREALNKYLEYAPFGEHARDARAMLDRFNSEINYKTAK
jgi:tetratricopeptide (TPR) repeat protein